MRRRATVAAMFAAAVFVVVSGVAFAAVFTGTSGDDSLVGTLENDRMSGLQGDDTLFGRGGRDRLSGGDNDDSLFGGRGRDIVIGGENSDRMIGGPDNDALFAADEQDDIVNCGAGVSDRAVVDDRDAVSGCERVSVIPDD